LSFQCPRPSTLLMAAGKKVTVKTEREYNLEKSGSNNYIPAK
jgi:hypothetical protein